jgi:penicillin-binding protein 1A
MESRLHGPSIEVDAPYVAEMVRNDMQAKYGDSIYTAGYQVFTTIDSRLQPAATVALRTGLLNTIGATAGAARPPRSICPRVEGRPVWTPNSRSFRWSAACGPRSSKGRRQERPIYVKDLGLVTLPWEKMSWARRELPDEKTDRAPPRPRRS